MTSLDIVFGYDATSICERMTALLAARDFELIPHYCGSKIGLMEYLASRKNCDLLILPERMPSGPYKARDLVWLHEEYNVNIIPLLTTERIGTDYMRDLYCGGILTAEFPGRVTESQLPDVLVTLILRGRSHETAKVYYRVADVK